MPAPGTRKSSNERAVDMRVRRELARQGLTFRRFRKGPYAVTTDTGELTITAMDLYELADKLGVLTLNVDAENRRLAATG